jgi:hypothetical protein
MVILIELIISRLIGFDAVWALGREGAEERPS